jgi:hypothetical protein
VLLCLLLPVTLLMGVPACSCCGCCCFLQAMQLSDDQKAALKICWEKVGLIWPDMACILSSQSAARHWHLMVVLWCCLEQVHV